MFGNGIGVGAIKRILESELDDDVRSGDIHDFYSHQVGLTYSLLMHLFLLGTL
jgi:hypothetical protein